MKREDVGMISVILTVMGSDRPGLTQALAAAVKSAGGNWLESHLSRLGGRYVGSVLVELPEAQQAALEAAVQAVDAAGLAVTLVAAADEGEGEADGKVLALELVGQDRPGIVSEVTAVLAGLHVNIDRFTTSIENGAWSGERLFRAKAELRLPPGVTADDVGGALEAISGEIMVDFSVRVAERVR